jgi:glycosyltransferase involved in cell wall biosynthesis
VTRRTELPASSGSATSDPSSRLHVGLFGIPPLSHGGGFEEYLIGLANVLTVRGHQVSVITASALEHRVLGIVVNIYYRNPLLTHRVRATPTEVRARLGAAELFEVPVWRMGPLLRRCDVVYAKNELLDLSVLRMLGMRGLPPVICGVHTPMWYPRSISPQARLHNRLYLGSVYRRLLAGISAVHVSNSYDASLFPRVHGWPPDRVISIPYPYAVDGWKPPLGTPADGPLRVLWAARLTEQKGVDTLLGVIESINASLRADEYVFLIAGSGDPRLERQIESAARRSSNVRYLAHVPHQDMPLLYEEVDAALVTSNWETFPFSCLEPQARGIPVVASNIPGCSDIVEHAVTGFLFEPGEIAAAVEALNRLEELRRRSLTDFEAIRRQARRRIHERFDPRVIDDALERMLLDVARRNTIDLAR